MQYIPNHLNMDNLFPQPKILNIEVPHMNKANLHMNFGKAKPFILKRRVKNFTIWLNLPNPKQILLKRLLKVLKCKLILH